MRNRVLAYGWLLIFDPQSAQADLRFLWVYQTLGNGLSGR